MTSPWIDPPCHFCDEQTCRGECQDPEEWALAEGWRRLDGDKLAQSVSELEAILESCAECGARLALTYSMDDVHWRPYCTADYRHRGSRPPTVEVVDASMLEVVA